MYFGGIPGDSQIVKYIISLITILFKILYIYKSIIEQTLKCNYI